MKAYFGQAVLGILLALVVSLAGCDRRSGAASGGGAEGAEGTEGAKDARRAGGEAPPAEVRLGYFANLTHAQAVLGVASGDYQKAVGPAVLKTKVFNAGPSLVEAMLAGELDLGYVGPGPAVAGYVASGGRGLKVISGSAANGVVIVARSDAAIASLSDLAGKKVATPQLANTQDIAARHYLKGVLKAEISGVLPVQNAEQVTMMQRGAIDAAWVPEPWGARLMIESKARLIAEEKDFWPGGEFATTVVVASPKFLKEHPETVKKFLEAHRQWTGKLSADPAGQLPQLDAALFDLTKKRMPEGTLPQAIARVKFTDDPLTSSMETMAQWAYELEFAKQKPKLEGLVEAAFAGKTVLQQAQPEGR